MQYDMIPASYRTLFLLLSHITNLRHSDIIKPLPLARVTVALDLFSGAGLSLPPPNPKRYKRWLIFSKGRARFVDWLGRLSMSKIRDEGIERF